jgi:ATP-binding cassette subfamily C protein
MRAFLYFARTIPWQTLVVVSALLVSGVLSGLGMAALFPVLEIVLEGGAGGAGVTSDFGLRLLSVLGAVGVPGELEPLLAVTLAIFVLKAVVLLLAKRQVGYAVTKVATGLRLRLLRALLRTNWSYYTRLPIGQATNALTSEADRAGLTYSLVTQMVQFAILVVIALALAFAISWQATLAVGAAGMLLTGALRFLVRMAGRAGRRLAVGQIDDAHAIALLDQSGDRTATRDFDIVRMRPDGQYIKLRLVHECYPGLTTPMRNIGFNDSNRTRSN